MLSKYVKHAKYGIWHNFHMKNIGKFSDCFFSLQLLYDFQKLLFLLFKMVYQNSAFSTFYSKNVRKISKPHKPLIQRYDYLMQPYTCMYQILEKYSSHNTAKGSVFTFYTCGTEFDSWQETGIFFFFLISPTKFHHWRTYSKVGFFCFYGYNRK